MCCGLRSHGSGALRDVRTEVDLRLLLDTQPTGTRAGNLMRLSGPALEVHLRSSTLIELQKALAERYGISTSTVKNILARRSWKHI